jgi:hypothetical protein
VIFSLLEGLSSSSSLSAAFFFLLFAFETVLFGVAWLLSLEVSWGGTEEAGVGAWEGVLVAEVGRSESWACNRVSVTCASGSRYIEDRAYPNPRHRAPGKDTVFVADSDSGFAVIDGLLVSSYDDTLDPSIEAADDIASTVGFLEIAALHLVNVVFNRLQLLVQLSFLDQGAFERRSQTLIIRTTRLVCVGHARRRIISHPDAR